MIKKKNNEIEIVENIENNINRSFVIECCKTCIISSCCEELCEKSVTEIIANPEFKNSIKEI